MANRSVNGIFQREQRNSDPLFLIAGDSSDRYQDRAGLLPDFRGVIFPERDDRSPSVDISERGGEVIVRAEMHGIQEEDIDVLLTEDAITIIAEKKMGAGTGKQLPVSGSSFCYASILPSKVKHCKARTQFSQGIFEIRLPKVENYANRTTFRKMIA